MHRSPSETWMFSVVFWILCSWLPCLADWRVSCSNYYSIPEIATDSLEFSVLYCTKCLNVLPYYTNLDMMHAACGVNQLSLILSCLSFVILSSVLLPVKWLPEAAVSPMASCVVSFEPVWILDAVCCITYSGHADTVYSVVNDIGVLCPA